MPQLHLFGFRCFFLFLCEDFDDCPTIYFCHVHDFVEVDLFFRVHRPVLSRIKVCKKRLYNDTIFFFFFGWIKIYISCSTNILTAPRDCLNLKLNYIIIQYIIFVSFTIPFHACLDSIHYDRPVPLHNRKCGKSIQPKTKHIL